MPREYTNEDIASQRRSNAVNSLTGTVLDFIAAKQGADTQLTEAKRQALWNLINVSKGDIGGVNLREELATEAATSKGFFGGKKVDKEFVDKAMRLPDPTDIQAWQVTEGAKRRQAAHAVYADQLRNSYIGSKLQKYPSKLFMGGVYYTPMEIYRNPQAITQALDTYKFDPSKAGEYKDAILIRNLLKDLESVPSQEQLQLALSAYTPEQLEQLAVNMGAVPPTDEKQVKASILGAEMQGTMTPGQEAVAGRLYNKVTMPPELVKARVDLAKAQTETVGAQGVLHGAQTKLAIARTGNVGANTPLAIRVFNALSPDQQAKYASEYAANVSVPKRRIEMQEKFTNAVIGNKQLQSKLNVLRTMATNSMYRPEDQALMNRTIDDIAKMANMSPSDIALAASIGALPGGQPGNVVDDLMDETDEDSEAATRMEER